MGESKSALTFVYSLTQKVYARNPGSTSLPKATMEFKSKVGKSPGLPIEVRS